MNQCGWFVGFFFFGLFGLRNSIFILLYISRPDSNEKLSNGWVENTIELRSIICLSVTARHRGLIFSWLSPPYRISLAYILRNVYPLPPSPTHLHIYTSDWPAAPLGRRSCVMSSRDKRRARPQGPEWPRVCPKRPHNQGEILQTCSMRTDVVSNSPPTLLPDESAPLSRSQSWTVSGLSHRYC